MSGSVVAKVGTEADFKAILGSFMDTVCKPCPGCGRDASRLSGHFREASWPRTQFDFQAFLGNFWARCAGHVRTHACSQTFWAVFGTRCVGQIRDKSWPRKGRSLISKHFSTVFGHRVQAMSGMHPGRDRDITSF
ncbi:Hypothetical predicted protein [Olea europaea subsp. europaea]|uniref:Uncharacterized protein n=1 Tax=Olea europaea subsp. europaea TaxID=158383 RepID=A0A8S0PNA6_OLEEU|nr:Hypothetical predicted protein [Olea europaea subsp. europaea]